MVTKKIITILVVILLVSAANVKAVGHKDFYSDGVIQHGDEYWNVGVYDTPSDHTIVDMTGGIVDSFGTFDESTINVSGGYVSSINAYDYSTINISGGAVYGLEAWENSSVNFSDGADVFAPRVRGSGTINMSGGIVDHIGAIESGNLNLYGGIVSDGLLARDLSVVNIFGYDLVKTDIGGKYAFGLVSGYWNDSTPFNINLNGSDTYSRVMLIPEPSTLLLFLISVPFVRRFIR